MAVEKERKRVQHKTEILTEILSGVESEIPAFNERLASVQLHLGQLFGLFNQYELLINRIFRGKVLAAFRSFPRKMQLNSVRPRIVFHCALSHLLACPKIARVN